MQSVKDINLVSAECPYRGHTANREPLVANKVCHMVDLEHRFKVHRYRVKNAKSLTKRLCDGPPRFKFLDVKISKNFHLRERNMEMTRENTMMLKKLADISTENVRYKLEKSTKPQHYNLPDLPKIRDLQRRRKAEKIFKDNIMLLKRMQGTKPFYDNKDIKRHWTFIKNVKKLRKTDYTTGHLPFYPADIKETRLKQLKKLRSKTNKSINHNHENGNGTDKDSMNNNTISQTSLTEDGNMNHLNASSSITESGDHNLLDLQQKPKNGALSSSSKNGVIQSNSKTIDCLNELSKEGYEVVDTFPDSKDDGDGIFGSQAVNKNGKKVSRKSSKFNLSPMANGNGDSKTNSRRESVMMKKQGGRRKSVMKVKEDNDVDETGKVRSKSKSVESGDDMSTALEKRDKTKEILLAGEVVLEDIDKSEKLGKVTKEKRPFRIRVLMPFDGFFEIVVNHEKGKLVKIMPLKDVDLLGRNKKLTEEDIESLRLHDYMISIFNQADTSQNGRLNHADFMKIMKRMNLGIGTHDMRMVIAEADENDDGSINYKEFVPMAIELIQGLKARIKAQTKTEEKECEIDIKTVDELNQSDFHHLVRLAYEKFEEYDVRNVGCIRRNEFKRSIRDPRLALPKQECNMLMAYMPVKGDFIIYTKFTEVFRDIRFMNIKNNIRVAHTSDIGKYLLDLCKQEERKSFREDFQAESDVPYTGMISVRLMTTVFVNAKHLCLSRIQVASILSDANVVEGEINYYEFIPTAANIIEEMFSPSMMNQKAQLMKESESTFEDLLKSTGLGQGKEEVEATMTRLFKMHDVDNSGYLDGKEFIQLIQDLNFDLSMAEINALMMAADVNNDDKIDHEEFLTLAYDHLLQMAREKNSRNLLKQMKKAQKEAVTKKDNEKDEHSTIQDIEEQSESLEKKLRSIFKTIDTEEKGFLTPEQFKGVVNALDLSITDFQMMMIMAEADENADGMIQYIEFVPLCLDILQAFETKKNVMEEEKQMFNNLEFASSKFNDKIDTATATELDQIIGLLMKKFVEMDPEQNGYIDRAKVVDCLRDGQIGLPRTEINMLLSQFTSSTIAYLQIPEKIIQARCVALSRKRFANSFQSEALEEHLFNIFKKEEMGELDGSSLNSMDREGNSVSTPPQGFSYLLSTDRVRKCIEKAKHLNLSRMQVLAVMSLGECENGTNMINYHKFVSIAADMITRLFDSNDLKFRTEVTKKINLSDSKLMKITKEKLERNLTDACIQFDPDERGILSIATLLMVLKGQKLPGINQSDLYAAVSMAEKDAEGNVFWKKFVETAYYDFLHILKERRIMTALEKGGSDDQIKEFKVTEKLSKDVLIGYAKKIIERAYFQVSKNNLKIVRKTNDEIPDDGEDERDPNGMSGPLGKKSVIGILSKNNIPRRSNVTEGILLHDFKSIKVLNEIFNRPNILPENFIEEIKVEITIKQLTPLTGRDVEVYVYKDNEDKELICASLKLKMPSLSLGDEDLAKGFAHEVDRQLVLWQNAQSKEMKLGLLDTDWSHLSKVVEI